MASVAVAVLLFLQSFLARCHRSQIQLVHNDDAGLTVQDVYYWALELDNNTAAALANLHWESVTDYEEARRSGIVMKNAYHVTLLFIGGATDEELARRNPKFPSARFIRELRQEFQRRAGERIELSTAEFVWEEGRIAAVPVELGDFYSKGVGAVVSNELLARLAASRNFVAGLGQWLFQLHLDTYATKIAAYCQAEGIQSPEQLSQKAREVAASVEPDPAAAAKVAGILGNATLGALHEHPFDAPLVLTGVLKAMSKDKP